jgi:hypothetical protein
MGNKLLVSVCFIHWITEFVSNGVGYVGGNRWGVLGDSKLQKTTVFQQDACKMVGSNIHPLSAFSL